jgi:hypothetical protein
MNKKMKFSSSTIVIPLAILIVELLSAGLTEAKCRVAPVPERFRNARAVFTGKVMGIEPGGREEGVRLKIIKSWKGPRKGEVIVSNLKHPEASRFEEGRSYLVFAGGERGKYWTGICSGTLNVESAESAMQELDQLRGRKP